MRVRRAGLQIWAIVTILWLSAVGIVAMSAYGQANLSDQVGLQQQAKDIRAAGGDPAQYDWGGPIQLGTFTVPAVQQEAPYFWKMHGHGYALMAASVPVTLLVAIETLAQLIEGIAGLRASSRRRRSAAEPAAG